MICLFFLNYAPALGSSHTHLFLLLQGEGWAFVEGTKGDSLGPWGKMRLIKERA